MTYIILTRDGRNDWIATLTANSMQEACDITVRHFRKKFGFHNVWLTVRSTQDSKGVFISDDDWQ